MINRIDREFFEREGYLTGLLAMSVGEVKLFREELLYLYESLPADLHKHFINIHGMLDWANRLGRHPAILEAVEALIGPDIFLWKSRGFAKFPGPGHVSWHQDLPHWNLVPNEGVTAWVALDDVNEANGCVCIIPGSHQGGARANQAAANDVNGLFSAGLQFAISEAEVAQARPMLLKAGEFSLHHGMIVHGSGANNTKKVRPGVALVYIPAYTVQRSAPDRQVVLVRGQDPPAVFFRRILLLKAIASSSSPWPKTILSGSKVVRFLIMYSRVYAPKDRVR